MTEILTIDELPSPNRCMNIADFSDTSLQGGIDITALLPDYSGLIYAGPPEHPILIVVRMPCMKIKS